MRHRVVGARHRRHGVTALDGLGADGDVDGLSEVAVEALLLFVQSALTRRH
jgi:hypothetical protein